MNNNLKTIDPSQKNIPENAIIQKVTSEDNRLSQEEHEKAVKAFLISDSIASGIGEDFAFVEKIPQLIKEIIEDKAWECLYVSKGVVTPYYCRYNKGSDSENFRAFISAKRPNGLGTTIETIDRLLEAETDVQWMFRTIIYESRQGERSDLSEETSRLEGGKLNELSNRHQERLRAANRAGEAIPEVRDLLDRGLISIDVAAKLGRDIKDTNNLTAEEREYIDKRDLIGVRIRQYINTNTIPEDEDQEPAYSRKLNRYVKDLLGIKDRSKSVRMDNPKIAAKKLLEFYKGEKLKQLIEILQEGLQTNQINTETSQIEEKIETNETTQQTETVENESLSDDFDFQEVTSEIYQKQEKNDQFSDDKRSLIVQNQSDPEELSEDKVTIAKQQLSSPDNQAEANTNIIELTREQLARRLNVVTGTLQNAIGPKRIASFPEWTKNKDPDGIAWQRTRRKDNIWYFSPVDNNYRIISRG
jgi:hypothetical protein